MDWAVLGLIVLLVASAIYYPQFPEAASVYRRFRRPQRLTCPATGTRTLVQVAAGRVAWAGVVPGPPCFRVRDSARWWGGEKDCKRDCLGQVV